MSILQRLAEIAAAAKQPTSKPSKPARKAPKATQQDWSVRSLSAKQKAAVCQIAKKAHRLQHDLGLADYDPEIWRREQQEIACGKASLKDCGQKDFLSLMAHFQRLAGQETKAKKSWQTTGRVRGSKINGDTHENRSALHAKIKETLEEHAEYMKSKRRESETIGWPYAWVICKNKFAGSKMQDLNAYQLEQLFFTLKNRIAKKEGVPEIGRNKGMRKK